MKVCNTCYEEIGEKECVKCEICFATFCKKDAKKCKKCKRTFCISHLTQCYDCKELYCSDCYEVLSCFECGMVGCEHCIYKSCMACSNMKVIQKETVQAYGFTANKFSTWEVGTNQETLVFVEFKVFKEIRYLVNKKGKVIHQKIKRSFHPVKGLVGGRTF